VPAGLIDHEHSMGTGRDDRGDLREVQVHRLGVASRQDQGRALAILWADGAEDIGGGGALIAGSAGTGATLCPSAGDLVLLADTSLICEPDFYLVAVDRLFPGDFIQARGEVFFKILNCTLGLGIVAWPSREFAIARSSRLSVCLAMVMLNSSKIHCARSINRQRTTP
jgi:hypothetical protein